MTPHEPGQHLPVDQLDAAPPDTYRVIATLVGATLADTAVVTVSAPANTK